jgi:hypothetical protein
MINTAYPFCMTASKLRQAYSSAASLNSATELGAMAFSNEHTFRELTATNISKGHICAVTHLP